MTSRSSAIAFVVAALAIGALATPVAHADQVVGELTGFTSPSGNIGCMIDTLQVRCDIRERDWAPPPRPADCEFDYGQGITLGPGRSPGFVCAGDTALAGGPPLRYGESISAGVLRCTSTASAMTCTDTATGHGFSIARQGYQFF
ncbi:hypothetical protein ORI20_25965 [Mycobacterium sp. CVI_P3]|uniref:Uncharacterized protein n=1 Tax=Mycobacterium pinniadriaticum TaxID=2994102 RepID=A0ABT3SKU5_9MYCO|nr:DUF6636 domain-containing protein [Mycobacterium pinniadriaticum]MCX2933723.1 hypothetical protein [Mycobacterium pinniadriaticum]MCX2940145.1 hypothetical protein [Mycobacterium pinniadriaticum]